MGNKLKTEIEDKNDKLQKLKIERESRQLTSRNSEVPKITTAP